MFTCKIYGYANWLHDLADDMGVEITYDGWNGQIDDHLMVIKTGVLQAVMLSRKIHSWNKAHKLKGKEAIRISL